MFRFEIRSENRLKPEEITKYLQSLRKNSFPDSSGFAVSALLEIKTADGYCYVGGVNVENHEHNRLSMHAEQTAMANAQAIFGDNFKVEHIYVMGAPEGIEPGSDNPCVNNFTSPCGHCRQLLRSRLDKNTPTTSISLNGSVGETQTLSSLLPNAFSEYDLNLKPPAPSSATSASASTSSTSIFTGASPQSNEIIFNTKQLDKSQILRHLRSLEPHIIDPNFKTSPVAACLLKIGDPDQDMCFYAAGTLVEDAAFLTTDAVFAAVAAGVTCIGRKINEAGISEIHLFSEASEKNLLSSAELGHLRRFADMKTPVIIYTPAGYVATCTLEDCIMAYYNDKLLSNNTQTEKPTPSPVQQV